MSGFFDRLWGKAQQPQAEPRVELPVFQPIEVPEIGALELKARLAAEEPPLLLDVREPPEWADGGIPGAVQMPMNSVPDRLGELPRDRDIIVYCHVGQRSYVVAEFLLRNGYNRAVNLDGGIAAWQMLEWQERRKGAGPGAAGGHADG